MLAYTSFSPNAERTQVTANIQLKDLSWQQLLDIYDAEKANPGQHTIKVQVPYAVGTTDPTEATQLASEQVSVTGTFNFFASSTTPAQVFNLTRRPWQSHSRLPTASRPHRPGQRAGLMKRTATTYSPRKPGPTSSKPQEFPTTNSPLGSCLRMA